MILPFILLAVTACSAMPTPQQLDATASQQNHIIPHVIQNGVLNDGTTGFAFQTVDGQNRAEAVAPDGSIRGSYSYTSPDGQVVKVNYIADEHGFRLTGSDPASGSSGSNSVAAAAPAHNFAAPAATAAPVQHFTPSFQDQHISAPQVPHFSVPATQTHFTAPAQTHFTAPAQTHFTAPAQTHFTAPAQTHFSLPAQSHFSAAQNQVFSGFAQAPAPAAASPAHVGHPGLHQVINHVVPQHQQHQVAAVPASSFGGNFASHGFQQGFAFPAVQHQQAAFNQHIPAALPHQTFATAHQPVHQGAFGHNNGQSQTIFMPAGGFSHQLVQQ